MVKIRKIKPQDLNFVLNSWLKSYRNTNKVRRLSNDVYFKTQSTRIYDILTHSETLIACAADQDDQIFGYLVYNSPDTVHYTYVKAVFRKMGVLKKLLTHAALGTKLKCTHVTQHSVRFGWKETRSDNTKVG